MSPSFVVGKTSGRNYQASGLSRFGLARREAFSEADFPQSMKVFLLVILALVLFFLLMFFLVQGKMIYFPRSYAANTPLLEKVTANSYNSDGKKQWVYLLKRDGASFPDRVSPDRVSPDRVWWLFGGNGSVALDWVSLVEKADPSANHAFVLFDYPGYGFNSGRPGPKAIFQSVDDAIPVVARQLALEPETLMNRSSGMGYSLGCAVALDSANRHGWNRVVAVSPFTTMQAMAERSVGGLLSKLLNHHYDNEVSIDSLVDRGDSRVTIFHGDADNIVPYEMGEALAGRDESGGVVDFVPVPRAGHNDIIGALEVELVAILNSE